MIMDCSSWKRDEMARENMYCLNSDNSFHVESEDSTFGLDVLTYLRSNINANYEQPVTITKRIHNG
jgi:hypothetical protein